MEQSGGFLELLHQVEDYVRKQREESQLILIVMMMIMAIVMIVIMLMVMVRISLGGREGESSVRAI